MCKWVQKNNGVECQDCGEWRPFARARNCSATHTPTVYLTDTSQGGLGDRIETALTAVGVTKERWGTLKGLIGLPNTCRCAERQIWLNQLGEQLGDAAKSAVESLWPKPEISIPLGKRLDNKPQQPLE